MDAYSTSVRITRAAPRWIERDPPVAATGDRAPDLADVATRVEDLTGQPFLAALGNFIDDVREAWRYSMRVLSDPDWRW
jgi:hypothetical protein